LPGADARPILAPPGEPPARHSAANRDLAMAKLIAVFFLFIGVAFFLVMTNFLSNTSETALVNGSFGLVPGVMGLIGGLIGRKSATRALVFGLLFVVLSASLLLGFLRVIWPRL
jgi:hypothetical protein